MNQRNDLVTLVTFTQPHRECLRFFYHNECGLWCPGYGHVTLNWVCSVIKLEEISSKDYWSNQNSDLRSTQQSCWKSRNLSMTKKSSQFSENDKNQMRYFGDFQTLWKMMTFLSSSGSEGWRILQFGISRRKQIRIFVLNSNKSDFW